jgi:DNA polymerase-1
MVPDSPSRSLDRLSDALHILGIVAHTEAELGPVTILVNNAGTGDCYLAFAKQVGAVPQDATERTHKSTRELFKQCTLAVQYGMGAEALALRIARPTIVARDLLQTHHETYRPFWRWSDAAIDHAMLTGSLHTVFGWKVYIGENSNSRSLSNIPMQANGAEMMRLAACLATERGIEVFAPVHDAFLICAPLNRLVWRRE